MVTLLPVFWAFAAIDIKNINTMKTILIPGPCFLSNI
jgi:hypothetical protein